MTRQLTAAVLIGYGSVGRYHAGLLDERYGQFAIVDFSVNSLSRGRDSFPNATLAGDLTELDGLDWPWETSMGVISTWGPSHAGLFTDLAHRGVRHILCEKPLAHSVKAGSEMIGIANEQGIALGVHMHLRYSGFVAGLNELSNNLGLGDPCSIVFHGGAIGLVTRGIHHIGLACEIFGRGPESVISSAVGEPINPRSPGLMFYGGTAIWDFGAGKEVTFSFSNSSSVDLSISIYYRDAVVRVFKELNVEIRRRVSDEVERFPQVTRVGDPTDVAFTGFVPGFRSLEKRTTRLLEEIESGMVSVLPPSQALESLGACIGALAAGRCRKAVSLPIDPESELGRLEWPIS
jgi:predicted dehydrogenase